MSGASTRGRGRGGSGRPRRGGGPCDRAGRSAARRRRRITLAAVGLLVLIGAVLASRLRPSVPPPPADSPAGAEAVGTAADDPDAARPTWTERERRRILGMSPLGPPPPNPTNRLAEDPDAAAFGQRIFFDDRFARGPALSCASCHEPDRWFTDGRPLPIGARPGERNTPTVLDSAHQRWLFWDGRADSLWAQAVSTFEDPKEYDSSRVHVVRQLAGDPALRAAFESAVGPLPDAATLAALPPDATPQRPPGHPWRDAWDGMTDEQRTRVDVVFAGLGKAIAAYQRTLATGPSPFDRYVADLRAGGDGGEHLAPAAERGLRLFIGRADCRTCHLGHRFSDNAFHATGVPSIASGLERDAGRFDGLRRAQADPFNAAGRYSDAPDGQRARIVTASIGAPEDYAAFRTPGLRNVAETAPYMHAGQLASLEDVVRFYSTLEGAERFDHHGQTVLRRLELTEPEIADLVAFLESLTGTLPPASRMRPPSASGRAADAATSAAASAAGRETSPGAPPAASASGSEPVPPRGSTGPPVPLDPAAAPGNP